MGNDIINSTVQKLSQIQHDQGFLTYDDLMDVMDDYKVPFSKTDAVVDQLCAMGYHIYESAPSKEILCSQKAQEEDLFTDYAQLDYEQIYSDILEIEPGLVQVIEYARNIRPAQHGEAQYLFEHIQEVPDAKRRLFDMNFRRVISLAYNYYSNSNFEISDLIQIGSMGLLRAIQKYDETSGYAFGSYVGTWIYQMIERNTLYRGNGCYFPSHISDTIKRVIQIGTEMGFSVEQLYQTRDAQYIADLQEELNIGNEEVSTLLSYMQPVISIDEALDEYGESEILSDNSAGLKQMESAIIRLQLSKTYEKIFRSLTEKEKEIVKLRNGFYGNVCYTLEECGEMYGVTRERIRQIEKNAMRKMRHPSRAKYLREFL